MSDELERSFEAAVIAEPAEPTHCLAYADWLDERGSDDMAYCLRWMARRGRRPHRRLRYGPADLGKAGIAVPAAYGWGWYRLPPGHRRSPQFDPRPPDSAWLPRTTFAAIASADHVYVESWRRAVQVLASALYLAREDNNL